MGPPILAILLAIISVAVPLGAASTPSVAQTSGAGCAMAHCNPRISGQAGLSAPTGAGSAWHRVANQGSTKGLGCASNSSIAVCTFTTAPTVVAYDAGGNLLWSSSLLDADAFASVPLITSDGTVIVADNHLVVAYTSTGAVKWQTGTPGGVPTSANLTSSGLIVLATNGGPISVYDAAAGSLLGKVTLTATINLNGVSTEGIFETINTPAVYGTRVYISTQFRDSSGGVVYPNGRLYAVDVATNSSGQATLTPAWYYEFRAPSGASPLVYRSGGYSYIYFDGDGPQPGGDFNPQVFAVQDLGTSPCLIWSYTMPSSVVAAPAQDPRGGIWVFASNNPKLLRLDFFTGQLLQTINLSTVLGTGQNFVPNSAMTMSSISGQSVMLLTAATGGYANVYVAAINLVGGTLAWKLEVDQGLGLSSVPFGQFPIVLTASGLPVVVFSTYANGVWGLSQ